MQIASIVWETSQICKIIKDQRQKISDILINSKIAKHEKQFIKAY